jgi:hypothetical protein
MLPHIIFEWSGFDSNSKRFKNQLENEFGNCLEKEKQNFTFHSPSLTFGLLARFRPPGPLILQHSFLGRPSSGRRLLPVPPSRSH